MLKLVHILNRMNDHALLCLMVAISDPRQYRRMSFIPCYLLIDINHVHNRNLAKCVKSFLVLEVIPL